jgi:hypothetical protein
MKLISLFTGFILLVNFSTNGAGTPDIPESRYKFRFVENMPPNAQGKILVISTRNFKPDENYILKRGVQPRYGMFQFIAGTVGDSVYITPIKKLDEATGYLPKNRDFLVFVDGFGKSFNQILERGFELTRRFDINMVIFDWPTDIQSLKETINASDEVAANFVIAMNKLNALHENNYQSSSVSAIFHSMGNYIIKNITNRHLLKYMPKNLFSNIILNAAAVKQENHANWVEKLTIQKRIYITFNNEDKTLKGAKLLRFANQLGLGYKGRKAVNAQYVNFSKVASTEHNLFLGKTASEKNNRYIYSFYDQAVHGKEVNFNNENAYQILSPSEISFRFSLVQSVRKSP